jgi:FAD/FMN-containing dehydrogenase
MLFTPQLSDTVKGRVIAPDDPDYDSARTVFYGGIDRRPAAVVRPVDATDIARVVALAREAGHDIAVRSGGHSPARHGIADGGIVIDLSAMRGLQIDARRRVAWADAGLTAGEYTTAAGEHGLATPFGDTGSVGIGGITLAGGAGFLVRKHGLTIDDVLAAEIVTADGEILYVDADSHPDLFWAIRGGGGNFGVVTGFRFRLHEVPQVVGGMLFLPATAGIVERFVAEADAAPDELSTIANVMKAPPLPFLPAEHHGRPVIMAFITYAGDVDAGEKAVAPFRALATPLADMVRAMPYTGMYGGEPEQGDYRPTAEAHTMLMTKVDRTDADAIMDALESATTSMAVTQLRVLGGAMARVPVDATAFAHREARVMTNVASIYSQPEDREPAAEWVAGLARELWQGDDGAYVGFLADEGPERIRAAYPGATWDRLAAVKRRYDPDNVFRLNQNVPPA